MWSKLLWLHYEKNLDHLASQASLEQKKKEKKNRPEVKPGKALISRMYPAEEVFIRCVHRRYALTSKPPSKNAPQPLEDSAVAIAWPTFVPSRLRQSQGGFRRGEGLGNKLCSPSLLATLHHSDGIGTPMSDHGHRLISTRLKTNFTALLELLFEDSRHPR